MSTSTINRIPFLSFLHARSTNLTADLRGDDILDQRGSNSACSAVIVKIVSAESSMCWDDSVMVT